MSGTAELATKAAASAKAVTHRGAIAADTFAFEPGECRPRVRVESLLGDSLELRHGGRRELVVPALEARGRAMEQLGGDRDVSQRGEAFGDVADMRVDAERFLEDQQPARRSRPVRPRRERAQRRAIVRRQLDPHGESIEV